MSRGSMSAPELQLPDSLGVPTVQARRGDYDVNHYYTYEDARAAGRGATALYSLGRKPQVGRGPVRRVPTGRHCSGPMPPLQGSRLYSGPNPGLATWAMKCRPFRAERTPGRPGLAVVQEADADGDTTAAFTHDQGATIMPGVGTILSVREGEDSRFLHTDVQGTTRNVTSAAEAVIAAYDLDAFGVQRSHTGAYSTPYLFTGKERDPGVGLDYFIARQYKAGRGVFVSKDPVGPSEGWYLYVGARPLEAWDPEGQWGCNHRKCPQTVDPDRDRPHHEYDRREVASIPVNACPIGPGTGKKGTLRVERWWHGKVYFFMGCVPTGSWSGRETCAQTGVNTLEEMTAQRMLSCEPDPCGCLWADSCARDFVLNVRAAWDTCTEEAKAALRETIGEVVRSMVEECGGLAIGAGAEVPCLGLAAVVAPYAIGIAEVLGWGVVVWRAYVAGRECWTALKQAQTTYDKCMAEQGRIASQYSNLPTHYTGHWLLPPPPPPGQNFPECALWPSWQTAAGDGRAR